MYYLLYTYTMKKFTLIFLAATMAVLIWPVNNATAQDYTRDSLTMGPGYANDLYYRLTGGLVSEAPRANWDIAFYTARFSAGILINDGTGLNLYTYPLGDTSAWASVDTTGMSSWKNMTNSPTVWEDGAFNAHSTGHPDYGWGTYNMVTHNLTGDSIFVVAYPDGSIKKLWIESKFSAENIYNFKYANLDGTDEHKVEFNVIPYETKRFAYYSMVDNMELDREPAADLWDILFTKFINLVPDNEGNLLPYLVTGVANNVETGANHFYPVANDFNSWFDKDFSIEKNTIGADWKYFDMGTFSYKMVDSTCYFVKSGNDDVYKLSFVYWGGTSTGAFALDKKIVSLSAVNEIEKESNALNLFPMPAHDRVSVRMEGVEGDAQLSIYDLNGRQVLTQIVTGSELQKGVVVSINMPTGLYIAKLSYDQTIYSQKLMVQ